MANMKANSELTVVLVLCVAFVSCEHKMRLETNSIFYGMGWMAARTGQRSLCHQQLVNISTAIDHQERWAIKLLDASGLPSTGLHWGNTFWLGSRDQCLKTSSDYKHLNPRPSIVAAERRGTPPFEVDYFVAYLRHDSELQISVYWFNETKVSLGLCLPSSCSEGEVSELLQDYFDSNVLYQMQIYNMSLRVLETKKTSEDFSPFDSPMSVLFIFATIAIALLVWYGTWYDLNIYRPLLHKQKPVEYEINGNVHDKNLNLNAYAGNGYANGYTNGYATVQKATVLAAPSKPEISTFDNIALSFSWYTNLKTVFNLNPRPGTLLPICGLRLYATTFVIVSHSFLFAMDFYDNKVYAFNITESLLGQFFINSSFATDAFFCISGFLMAHGFFKTITKKNPEELSSWGHFSAYLNGVLRRFLRITPSYLYTMGLTFLLAAWRYGSSSLWMNERNDLLCPQLWWTNVLYINNVYPGKKMCMSWSYYLANEMQFFVIITLVCHLSRKYFKAAIYALSFLFVGSIVAIAMTTYVTEYKPFAVHFFLMIDTFYYPPWMRIGPYIIGACYGYLFQRMNGKLDINQTYITALWVLMISIGMVLEFGFKERDMNPVASVLYMSLSRNLWALMVGWIILACLTGNGGHLNRLLSLRLWVPLSQLTYWAYLINPIITYTVASFNEKSWQLTISGVLLNSAGLVLVTYLFSIVMVISIEMPFDKIVAMMFKSNQGMKPLLKKELSVELETKHNNNILNKME